MRKEIHVCKIAQPFPSCHAYPSWNPLRQGTLQASGKPRCIAVSRSSKHRLKSCLRCEADGFAEVRSKLWYLIPNKKRPSLRKVKLASAMAVSSKGTHNLCQANLSYALSIRYPPAFRSVTAGSILPLCGPIKMYSFCAKVIK